jgi:hypothetical protein
MPEDNIAPESNPQEDGIPKNFEERQVVVSWPDTFIYTNASAYSVSLMDVRIAFADAGPNGPVTKVAVTMTHEHAAHLVLTVLQSLHAFEEAFGPIRLPDWRRFQEGTNALRERFKKEQSQP